MKNVCIIAGDAVPFPIKKGVTLQKEDYDSYINATFSGIRCWKFAEYLSKHKYDVTLLIPDNCYPENLFKQDVIDKETYSFRVDSYNFKLANWGWSQELDRKLKKFNFVICQTANGAGLYNCSVLPSEVNVIIDGWTVLPLEFSSRLLSFSKIGRKVQWSNFEHIYRDLIVRCNCLIYANEKQKSFYEGLFFGFNKLNYNAFQFSPILKIPFGVEKKVKIKEEFTKKNYLKLFIEGPISPWDSPEIIFKQFYNSKNVNIDFVTLQHPRQNKIYNSYFKPFFEDIDEVHNFEFSCNSVNKIDYDYQIVISRNWVIDSYLHRPEILEAISYGVPVITNVTDAIYNEIDFISKSIVATSPMDISKAVDHLFSLPTLHSVDAQQLQEFTKVFSWENVLLPLFSYLDNF